MQLSRFATTHQPSQMQALPSMLLRSRQSTWACRQEVSVLSRVPMQLERHLWFLWLHTDCYQLKWPSRKRRRDSSKVMLLGPTPSKRCLRSATTVTKICTTTRWAHNRRQLIWQISNSLGTSLPTKPYSIKTSSCWIETLCKAILSLRNRTSTSLLSPSKRWAWAIHRRESW